MLNNNNSNNNSNNNDLYILSIICKGLDLISSSSLLNSGFLSRVTGGSIPRNVKKVIRVQKSDPFSPGGRPTSLLYDTIYESEPVEDIVTFKPSLLPEIRIPSDKDCKLRINVYYSSSLTNGKEILLAATSFGFKELLRSKQIIFSSPMVSEHCNQAIAYIRVITSPPAVFKTNSIQSTSPITNQWNPMFRRYIFHPDIEQNPPVVCEEYTWEPRLTFNVSYKYLMNLSNVLTQTLTAWKVRYELERVRQGKFVSREEAFLNGWYELTISPSSCMLNAIPRTPYSSSVDEEHPPNFLTNSGEEKNINNINENRIRIGSDDNISISGNSQDSFSSPSSRLSTNGNPRQRKISNPSGLKLPSCYIEIVLEHKDLTFSSPLGRTNTEYHTFNPCFGSNMNPKTGQRGNTSEYQLSPLADPDNVQISRVPFEYPIDDTSIIPETKHVKNGSKSCFHVFVPFCSGGRIRCDLYVEDTSGNTGKGILVGSCYRDLNDLIVSNDSRPSYVKNPDRQIPINITNSLAEPKWQILDAELSLGVSIQQQPQPQQQQQSLKTNLNSKNETEVYPPVSPHIPYFYFSDYNEKSIGIDSFSKSLGLFGENDIDQTIENIIDKIALDRFSDSDDEDDDDDDEEFTSQAISKSSSSSSRKLQSSPIQQQKQEPQQFQEIITPSFPNIDISLDKEILPESPRTRVRNESLSNNNVPRNLRKASVYSAEILGECYEWLWHIGFKGIDPLIIPSENNNNKQKKITEIHSFQQYNNSGEYLQRIDIPYSLIWMNEHLKRIEHILCQIKYLIATYFEEITLNKTFRASKLKKEAEYQAIPINLHIQNMVVQKCSGNYDLSLPNGGNIKQKLEERAVHVMDSITCGAMACHGLGYSHGGLHNIETTLQRSKANLEMLKKQFINDINPRSLSYLPIITNGVGSNQELMNNQIKLCYKHNSREYQYQEFLTTSISNYENSTTNILLRRIYCLSQILSIAVNSFIYKLELVIEGHISSYFLERWFSYGFLILFECLLSVNGKERAMLEDTRTATDMIQLYHIRVLPSPNGSMNLLNQTTWYLEQTNNQKKCLKWLDTIDSNRADIHIIGREVLLFIPERNLEFLPSIIQMNIKTTGAIFNIKTALFSQGIDIMQSMTNAWDSHESGLSSRDLQYQVNISGLHQLNAYCELVQPVHSSLLSSFSSSSQSFSLSTSSDLPPSPTLSPTTSYSNSNLYSGLTQEAHPLTDILSNIILTTNINEKNVEMLIEVERIGRILGTCRVTFCKSGKDRTGMAITLEQSRLLGENFDCGQSPDRIIRDANIMRQYGTRLMVAEKNIGRAVYAINRLQIKFLPLFYRPPIQLTEELIKKSDNS